MPGGSTVFVSGEEGNIWQQMPEAACVSHLPSREPAHGAALFGVDTSTGYKALGQQQDRWPQGCTASELEGTRTTGQLFTLLGLAAPLMPGKLLCGHLFFPPISTAALLFQIRCRNGSQNKKKTNPKKPRHLLAQRNKLQSLS